MTEEPVRKDSEIQRSNSSMGCGHKDDKASLASSQIAPYSHQPSAPASKEVWKKGGRMFSILLAVHLALLACTLVSSGAFEKIAVHDYDVFFLLTVMMLIVIVWIIFYLVSTARCPDAILCRDSHAGPIWLRGGSSWGANAGGKRQAEQFTWALIITRRNDPAQAPSPVLGSSIMPCFRSAPSPSPGFTARSPFTCEGSQLFTTPGSFPALPFSIARPVSPSQTGVFIQMTFRNPF